MAQPSHRTPVIVCRVSYAACGLGLLINQPPDKDQSVNGLIAGFPADGPLPPILPPREGFLFLDRDKFHASFAGDVPAGLAAFMADSQVRWGVDATAVGTSQ